MSELKDIKERLTRTHLLFDKLDEKLAIGEISELQYMQLTEKYKVEAENLKNQITEKELLQEVGLEVDIKEDIHLKESNKKSEHLISKKNEIQIKNEPIQNNEFFNSPPSTSNKQSIFGPSIIISFIIILTGITIWYFVIASDINNSQSNDFLGGVFNLYSARIFEEYGWQFAGIYFYASHFIPIGGSSSFLDSIVQERPLMLLVPIILLLIGGYIVAKVAKPGTKREALDAGSYIGIPYSIFMTILTLIFSFQSNFGFGKIGFPDIFVIFIVCIIYGTIFGGIGGIICKNGNKKKI